MIFLPALLLAALLVTFPSLGAFLDGLPWYLELYFGLLFAWVNLWWARRCLWVARSVR